jgi:Ca2+/Na+ antiporter
MVNTVDNIKSKNGKMAWINDEIFLGRLVLFYYTVAILGVVNLLYFLICAYFYQYKGIKKHRENSDSDYNEINDSGTDEFHQELSTPTQIDSYPSTQFES